MKTKIDKDMTVWYLRKLIKDLPDEAKVRFTNGDQLQIDDLSIVEGELIIFQPEIEE